jgi:ComEC/Rec2-related protein
MNGWPPEPVPSAAVFSEAQLLALMAAVWSGVVVARPIPIWIGAAGVCAALVIRARVGFAISLVLLASGLGAAAEAAYIPADRASLENVQAVMVVDPEPTRFGWRAEAKLSATGQRVRLLGNGFGRPDLVAGEPVRLSGRIAPIPASAWSKSRHLVGVVTVDDLRSAGDPAWYRAPGEWLRAGVLGSTSSFDPVDAALYHGLVIGDDRFQSEGRQIQFRAAGLSHLLAVSGQNVAFLLAVVLPLRSRLGPAPGFAVTLAVLVVFALATRLEPSVLRATMTAGVSVVAAQRSARAGGIRALCLAVIGLLCLDPFLSSSVGFRLSVGASLGILLFAPPIVHRLKMPNWVAEPLSITLAAQLGVSPILLAEFGPISTVTLPANLLAGWAAGAVMTLGLSIGLVAAAAPGPIAWLLQAPSRMLVWWIGEVAAFAARAPLPAVEQRSVPWLLLGLVTIWWLRPSRILPGWWLLVCGILFGLAALQLVPDVLSGRTAPPGWYAATDSTPSVLVVDDLGARHAEQLVAAKIDRIDVVVVSSGGWAAAQAVMRMREVVDIGVVLAPGDHRIVGGRRVVEDVELAIGDGLLVIVARPSQLSVELVGDPRDRR